MIDSTTEKKHLKRFSVQTKWINFLSRKKLEFEERIEKKVVENEFVIIRGKTTTNDYCQTTLNRIY